MQTFDDADILALAWFAMMFAVFIVVGVIAHYIETRGNRRVLPPPQPRAVVGHKRYYRITTSRINDNR